MEYKGLIIGAGILIIWGIIGALAGVGGAGPLGFMPPVLYVVVGVLPAWYVANQFGVAGYIATFMILYLWKASLFTGGA